MQSNTLANAGVIKHKSNFVLQIATNGDNSFSQQVARDTTY